jgi:hypothetical protein
MSQSRENLDAALRAVAAGDWDALTPEQVERLERVLNQEPAIAARLTAQKPELGASLAKVLDALDRRARPTPRAWEGVWEQIESAAPAARGTSRRSVARILRLWPALAAAAACLLLAVAWTWTARPSASDEWPLRLATNVEIDDLEVPEGATSFVVETGGESGIQVIWVLEDQG